MVSESIIVTVVAGVFTVIGASISYLSARQSSKEATKRLYDRHALEARFNSIKELHTAFDECIASFRRAKYDGPSTIESYYEEVHDPFRDLQRSWDASKIYITEKSKRKEIEDSISKLNEEKAYMRTFARSSDEEYINSDIAFEFKLEIEEIDEIQEDIEDLLREELDPEHVK